MDCVREILGSKHLGAKILFLSITNILIGLWIAFALSYFDAKERLDVIEYQHRLAMVEIQRIAHRDSNQLINYHEQCERKYNLMHLATIKEIDKINNTLETMTGLSNRNDYLDRSGRTDFALETAGARILSIGNTTLISTPKWLSTFSFISNFFIRNGPNHAIQPSIHPGECFAFSGTGEIIIKLIKTIFIDAVSIEHILPQMSPNGNILSAPSNFSVYGMENEIGTSSCDTVVHLGNFRYQITKEQQPLQLFRVAASETSFPIVRFVFTSNHGDPMCTCVYRIRVHGSLTKPN